MVSEVLKVCVSKGYLLDKEILNFFEKIGINETNEILEKLTSIGVSGKILNKKVLEDNKIHFSKYFSLGESKNKDNFIEVKNFNLKNKKLEFNDFLLNFNSRYNLIKEILEKKDIDNLCSIRRVGNVNGSYNIIASVVEKRITKNKNLLLEVEDNTGKIIVLINRENQSLFDLAKNLMLDDIVCFKTNGSIKMLFCNKIIFPDAFLEKEKISKHDEYIAFSGDLHVGSKMFLENNFLKFIDWLNGEVGDDRQRALAKKIKYLFLTGDNIDGVGVFPDQEDYLNIKSCRDQYRKFAQLIDKIRKDVSIIICPGQHDSVWIGEMQNIIPEKWAKELHMMENVYLVNNPGFVKIRDFNILMYYGASINRFIDEMSEIRIKYAHNKPLLLVKEMLKRRHLAPTHGLMDYVPRTEDYLVIKEIPDIVVIGDQHRLDFDKYNNILLFASSCWKTKTPFEEKVGSNPDPCKVPLFNLKTREIKVMDFSGEESEVLQ